MARIDLSLIARAFVWLLVVASGVFFFSGNNKASALQDVDWRPDLAMFPPSQVIAIDLGNTNSCVAGYSSPEAESMFHICIPSWVAFSDDGNVLVGEDAMNHAAANPDATAIYGFKRLFGRRLSHAAFDEEEQEFIQRFSENHMRYNIVEKDAHPHIQVENTKELIGIEQVTLAVFAKLKAIAESSQLGGHKARAAIITLPYDCHTYQCRDAPLYAAGLAGFETTKILYEPIAAAVAYDLVKTKQLREEGNVLVLHVGGATAEATVMTFVDGVYEFIGARYDPFLGGQDFDRRITEHFVQLIKDKYGKDVSNDSAVLMQLARACGQAKKTLSDQDVVDVKIDYSLVHGLNMTREKFEELNHDLFLRVLNLVDKAVSGAEMTMGNEVTIDEVVLVGGSTMIPKVRELVRDYFGGKKELTMRLKPDEAVTRGALLYGKHLYYSGQRS